MENEKETGLDKGLCSQFQAGVIEGTRSDKSWKYFGEGVHVI